ncbi:hypothetical protein E2C01_068078 [Portunus trituberculatus]|uniref:Uncharacterized protein n=1 Tax=Portunus trituberculatus TaxID=210409 RepID=A0A5B7HLI1_PORTR|nr:hypothetical protein [Portunus trituberculatus]
MKTRQIKARQDMLEHVKKRPKPINAVIYILSITLNPYLRDDYTLHAQSSATRPLEQHRNTGSLAWRQDAVAVRGRRGDGCLAETDGNNVSPTRTRQASGDHDFSGC